MAEKTANVEKIESTLMEVEREYTSSPATSVVIGAYVLYIAHNTPALTELKDILDYNRVSSFLRKTVMERIGGHWEKYRPLLTMFIQSDLVSYFNERVNGERLCDGGRKSGVSSSLPVVDLVANILDIRRGESVCDLGCSFGDFVCHAYRAAYDKDNASRVVGYEITNDSAAIAEIRMRMACDDVNAGIEHFDMFSEVTWGDKFDKVFCEPPFGVRKLPESMLVQKFISRKFPDFPELSLSMAGDWLFAARAVAAMKDGGRAAVILPPSAITGAASEPYRRYFIQRNLIEAVVELPIRIFDHTGVVTYLVVFKKGSESIKMVRSGDLCEKGRRNNVIKEEHIRVIRGALGYESIGRKKFLDYVVEVTRQKILENDCDLSVRRLFDDSVTVKNGVAFGHFVNSAKRGATITSAELDDVACDNETGFLYLAPGNISDGVIDSKLMNLKEIPEKYEGYCAKTGDLIIARVSASGAGFRVVVVEVPDDKMVLPNGNLFVISVNKKLADPYFIKACLDSDYAQCHLQKSSVGSSVVTLNYKSLENLPIPDMPRERQKEIAKACRAYAKSVAEFREKLACAKKSLRNVLSETAPECINVSN